MGVAFALHLLGVVIWIGGVSMVTTVIIPAARRLPTIDERMALFSAVERRFVWQARGAVIVVGLSGADLATRLGLWRELDSVSYWWLWAMIGVWLIFSLMLFVVEPLLKRRVERRIQSSPESFAAIQRMHWVLLVLSAVAIAGGVAGSHSLSLFQR